MTLKLIKLNELERRRGGTHQWKDDDYAVLSNDWELGRIYKSTGAHNRELWNWGAIGGMGGPIDRIPRSGAAPSLEEAKQEVRKSFEAWLAYAGLVEAPTP
jgi:hypothetical protein